MAAQNDLRVGVASAMVGREPGLPFIECIGFPSVPCTENDTTINDFGWLNASQIGLTGSVPSQQWARLPITMTATASEFGFEFFEGPWDSNQTIDLRIRAFFVSPNGSRSNYGRSATIPVRTVAFGSIPIEAELQIEQSRDASGDPVPLEFIDTTRTIIGPQDRPDVAVIYSNESDEPLRADVDVEVRRLVVDGVPLSMDEACGTGNSSELEIKARPYEVEASSSEESPEFLLDPDEFFVGISGGSLHGSINISPFRNCITSEGDDVSPLLTSAISGSGNPVTAKTGIISCTIIEDDGRFSPIPPGVNSPVDPRSGCDNDLRVGQFTSTPSPLAIPDSAPSPVD